MSFKAGDLVDLKDISYFKEKNLMVDNVISTIVYSFELNDINFKNIKIKSEKSYCEGCQQHEVGVSNLSKTNPEIVFYLSIDWFKNKETQLELFS